MMNQIKYLVNGGARLMRWPLRCGLVCLALARAALAADALYQIDYPVSYVIPAPTFCRTFTRPISSTTPVRLLQLRRV